MNLKELRQSLGWSQEKMARELDISLGTWRNWEYGVKPSPMAQRILDKFLAEHRPPMLETEVKE